MQINGINAHKPQEENHSRRYFQLYKYKCEGITDNFDKKHLKQFYADDSVGCDTKRAIQIHKLKGGIGLNLRAAGRQKKSLRKNMEMSESKCQKTWRALFTAQ